jgi:hypothetical protein
LHLRGALFLTRSQAEKRCLLGSFVQTAAGATLPTLAGLRANLMRCSWPSR